MTTLAERVWRKYRATGYAFRIGDKVVYGHPGKAARWYHVARTFRLPVQECKRLMKEYQRKIGTFMPSHTFDYLFNKASRGTITSDEQRAALLMGAEWITHHMEMGDMAAVKEIKKKMRKIRKPNQMKDSGHVEQRIFG